MTKSAAKEFIVKVQMPLAGAPDVLVYNEDRSVFYHGPFDDAVRSLLCGEVKVFLWAHMADGSIHLGRPAPWQDW